MFIHVCLCLLDSHKLNHLVPGLVPEESRACTDGSLFVSKCRSEKLVCVLPAKIELMGCTVISESIFAGVVLKVLGSTTLGLALNLLRLYTTVAGGSRSAERAFGSWGHVYKNYGCPCAHQATKRPFWRWWRDGHWTQECAHLGSWYMAGFSSSFRDVFHQGSQCLSLIWRLKPASKPDVGAPGAGWKNHPVCCPEVLQTKPVTCL